jgi:hypothetical protein
MWLLLYHRTHTHGRWPGILAGAAAAPPSAVDGGCPEGAPDGYWLIFRPANGPTWTPYYGSATKQRTANTERKSFNAEWSRTSGSRHNISHSCRPSHSLHWPTPILEPPGYRRHSFNYSCLRPGCDGAFFEECQLPSTAIVRLRKLLGGPFYPPQSPPSQPQFSIVLHITAPPQPPTYAPDSLRYQVPCKENSTHLTYASNGAAQPASVGLHKSVNRTPVADG